mmetsp:Transcript_24341/g.52368  ORF Transcript_24341/g.52368 Transcript_24341/m.52368 type:complete len:327 (+) Transcript_24341:1828-2808(+)
MLVLACEVAAKSDTHLPELVRHQVLAVRLRAHEAEDAVEGILHPGADVLAPVAPQVAGLIHPVKRGAFVQANVRDKICRRHVARVLLGRLREHPVEVKGRLGLLGGPLEARKAAPPRHIGPLERRRGSPNCVDPDHEISLLGRRLATDGISVAGRVVRNAQHHALARLRVVPRHAYDRPPGQEGSGNVRRGGREKLPSPLATTVGVGAPTGAPSMLLPARLALLQALQGVLLGLPLHLLAGGVQDVGPRFVSVALDAPPDVILHNSESGSGNGHPTAAMAATSAVPLFLEGAPRLLVEVHHGGRPAASIAIRQQVVSPLLLPSSFE